MMGLLGRAAAPGKELVWGSNRWGGPLHGQAVTGCVLIRSVHIKPLPALGGLWTHRLPSPTHARRSPDKPEAGLCTPSPSSRVRGPKLTETK